MQFMILSMVNNYYILHEIIQLQWQEITGVTGLMLSLNVKHVLQLVQISLNDEFICLIGWSY